MSDARARPSQSAGKSIAGILALAIIATAAATPADALRIRVRPGFGSSAHEASPSEPNSADIKTAQATPDRPVIEQPGAPTMAKPANEPAPASAPSGEPAPASAPVTAEAAPVEPPKPVDPMADDDRTKKILADENRGVGKLHPLQTSNPDYNIVVCEAGCGDAKPHIIYQRPVASIRSALAEPKTPSLPSAKSAECRGGCDGGPTERTRSVTGSAPSFLNDAAGNWMTAVEPTLKSEPKSATPAAPSAPAIKPQASTAGREDWMARINRERAAAKAPEPSEPEVNFPSEPEVKETPLVPEPSNVRE